MTTESMQPVSRSAEPPERNAAPGYTLLLLFLANVLNFADRALLGIVVEPVKHDLRLTDTQISIASGAAFIVFNLLAGVFISRWADRGNRKRILLLGIVLWSLATAATGLAQGIWTLSITRVLVGVGEATCFPVAISMLADLYTPDRRPRSFSIFQASTFVGIVAGSILAGVLAAAHGWRAMFAVCGVVGFLLVLAIVLTLREPARAGNDMHESESLEAKRLGESLVYLMKMPGFAALAIGVALAAMGVTVLPIWAPTFLLRSHGVALANVGALIGPPVALGGILGTVIFGMIATTIARRRGSVIHGLLPPIVALPFGGILFAAFLFAPSLPLVITAIAAMNFMLSSVLGPCFAVAAGVAPARMRAVATTLVLVVSGLAGGAFAPYIVGALSDALAPRYGGESLRYALSILSVAPIIAAGFLWLAQRHFIEWEARVRFE